MSSKNILRKLTNWAVMASVAAVLYVFITPSYRQGEPSIAGKKAEDFPLSVAGRQTRLSEFRGKVVVLNFLGILLRFLRGRDARLGPSSGTDPLTWWDCPGR